MTFVIVLASTQFSTGTVISFAIELYENGILSKKETDGIDLNWGNHHAIVAMTEKIVKRERLRQCFG